MPGWSLYFHLDDTDIGRRVEECAQAFENEHIVVLQCDSNRLRHVVDATGARKRVKHPIGLLRCYAGRRTVVTMASERLRIGIIAPPWLPVPPLGYGGTDSVIDDLARGLSRLGHDVVLFTTGDSTCPVARRWALDHSQPSQVGNAMVEIRHIVDAYDTLHDMDIVHDHTVVGPLYAWRFDSLPVVTTNHGPFDDKFAALYRGAADRVAVIAISEHQASTATGVRIDGVIHHGIDPDVYPFGDGDGGYFVFLGRMTPDKGPREAALAARRAGVRLIMAAKMREPAEQAYFDEHVRPLLGGDVEYVGEVGPDEKVALLAGARALLNPIQWPEPFGLVMIEALACGTPVVAFPAGAAPEIVRDGDTGFLCGDVDSMAARIRDVEMLDRRRCRASIEGHFSTDRMCRQYEQLFKRMTRQRQAA
jgi:glycosyltransferase involved in cell wall biosynthesis